MRKERIAPAMAGAFRPVPRADRGAFATASMLRALMRRIAIVIATGALALAAFPATSSAILWEDMPINGAPRSTYLSTKSARNVALEARRSVIMARMDQKGWTAWSGAPLENLHRVNSRVFDVTIHVSSTRRESASTTMTTARP
jgi:hypothetical protein